MGKTTPLALLVQPYGGVVLSDNKTHKNRFEIPNSTGARRYTVAQMITTGQWQCACPGWVMKKAGRDRKCKHLTAMSPVLSQLGQIGS